MLSLQEEATYLLSEGSIASIMTWTSLFTSRDPLVQDGSLHLLDLKVCIADRLDITTPTPVFLRMWPWDQQLQQQQP